ncbi:MAG TPA: mechanosensitive ion channel family protein, partial [Gammaproteobacteria bacterium]|nr:mechanosensitive ion channel family protein [Gammaproteobacteria bacterium]
MTGPAWLTTWPTAYPWVYTLLVSLAVMLAAWLANWGTKRGLVRGFYRLLKATPLGRSGGNANFGVVPRLANIVPALVVWSGVAVVPGLPEALLAVVRNVCSAFIVLTLALAISAFLNLVNA